MYSCKQLGGDQQPGGAAVTAIAATAVTAVAAVAGCTAVAAVDDYIAAALGWALGCCLLLWGAVLAHTAAGTAVGALGAVAALLFIAAGSTVLALAAFVAALLVG